MRHCQPRAKPYKPFNAAGLKDRIAALVFRNTKLDGRGRKPEDFRGEPEEAVEQHSKTAAPELFEDRGNALASLSGKPNGSCGFLFNLLRRVRNSAVFVRLGLHVNLVRKVHCLVEQVDLVVKRCKRIDRGLGLLKGFKQRAAGRAELPDRRFDLVANGFWVVNYAAHEVTHCLRRHAALGHAEHYHVRAKTFQILTVDLPNRPKRSHNVARARDESVRGNKRQYACNVSDKERCATKSQCSHTRANSSPCCGSYAVYNFFGSASVRWCWWCEHCLESLNNVRLRVVLSERVSALGVRGVYQRRITAVLVWVVRYVLRRYQPAVIHAELGVLVQQSLGPQELREVSVRAQRVLERVLDLPENGSQLGRDLAFLHEPGQVCPGHSSAKRFGRAAVPVNEIVKRARADVLVPCFLANKRHDLRVGVRFVRDIGSPSFVCIADPLFLEKHTGLRALVRELAVLKNALGVPFFLMDLVAPRKIDPNVLVNNCAERIVCSELRGELRAEPVNSHAHFGNGLGCFW